MMLVKFTGYHNNKPVEEWNESFDSREEAEATLKYLGYVPEYYGEWRLKDSRRLIEKAVIASAA